MLRTREKIVVAAIPTAIALIFLWQLWLHPRLLFHSVAEGSWRDFSRVKHQRVDDDTVFTFTPNDSEALRTLMSRLDLTQGRTPGGSMEHADSILARAGHTKANFQSYHSRSYRRGLLYLYVSTDKSVIVILNI